MGVLFLLIIISMMVAAVFLGAFIWASKNGQFEDTYSPSVRILFEDKKENKPPQKKNKNKHD